MINRLLIRMKVLQILYAYTLRKDGNLPVAQNELVLSMDKAYDLYHYLLLLIVMLTDAEQRRVDRRRCTPFMAELDLNLRLYNNRLSEQLRSNLQLKHFANEKGSLWANDDLTFINSLLNKIHDSEFYAQYLETPDTFEADKDFWKKVLDKLILTDPDLQEILDNSSIYWTEDLELVGEFVMKTIRRFKASTKPEEPLLPMFRDEADRYFALNLLNHTILKDYEYREMINAKIKNWEIDRLAQTDLLILQIAIAEILNFPEIPTNVTLNEYIDLARYYSTPKSPNFINGALDAIAKDLAEEGKIFKA